MKTSTHTHTHIHTYTCSGSSASSIDICIYAYILGYENIYIHTHTHTYTHTYIHTPAVGPRLCCDAHYTECHPKPYGSTLCKEVCSTSCDNYNVTSLVSRIRAYIHVNMGIGMCTLILHDAQCRVHTYIHTYMCTCPGILLFDITKHR